MAVNLFRAMRKRLAVCLAAVLLAIAALVAAGMGIAYASIPDSSGVIHACYQSPPPHHGANLQVIDTDNGGSCGGGMVALTWNQTGPQGPPGPEPSGALVNLHIVQATTVLTPGGTDFARANCPSGEVATGGGFSTSGDPGLEPVESSTGANSNGVAVGWDVEATNNTSQDQNVTAQAECAQVTP
jgi:hypothetical protein